MTDPITFEDLSAWGDGPWMDEPSHVEWTHMDLKCVAQRHPRYGHWCAYVNVPADHPLYGISYSQSTEKLTAALDTRLEDPIGEFQFGRGISMVLGVGLDPTPEAVFDVHGGITYSGDGDFFGAPAGSFWYGFDCGHAWDLAPGMQALLRKLHVPSFGIREDTEVYRTIAFVTEQANQLAEQIAAVAYHYP